MRTLTQTFLAAVALTAGLGGAAMSQSLGAPAGREPATAPGGTTGIAGPRNEAEAIRSGDALAVPPGTGGVPVPPSVTDTTPAPEAPPAPQARP